MRQLSLAVVLVAMLAVLPLRAAPLDENPPDQKSIDALEAKALAAQPREQFYLYAQLVHEMTELSILQYAAGDMEKATILLKHVQALTKKIHQSLASDDKRLKDSEILLRHTAFRLSSLLQNSSSEDRPLLEQTLADVNRAQTDAMLEVFHK